MKWEYQYITGSGVARNCENIEKFGLWESIQQAGYDGWELVNTITSNESIVIFLFKRPIPEAPVLDKGTSA